MRERFGFNQHGLTMQMVLSFMVLVLLTAVAVGLPAMLLIRNQIARQAWSQVSQGSQATQALYAARQDKIRDLATLTTQRPTLRELLQQGETDRLSSYLQTLQTGTELDLLLVCDGNQQPVAQAGTAIAGDVCRLAQPAGFFVRSDAARPRLWLLQVQPVTESTADELGTVVVGVALDDGFLQQMQAQTGLAHTLLVERQPVASSLAGGMEARADRQPMAAPLPDVREPATLQVNGRPYYAAQVLLGESDIVDEVALPVSDIAATQQRLVWLMGGSILLVALVGSGLGWFLARRIGRPLAELAGAAAALSTGQLDAPVSVRPQVREVSQVAQALESARLDLQQTLLELRQAKAWTDHLLDAIVEGIVTLDQDGRVTFFSPGAERIMGRSRTEALGRSCDELFRLAESDEPFSRFIPLPGRQRKVTLALNGGRQATLAVTGARLAPPEIDRTEVALVFRDVSDAELVHRLLGQFLANITHEFRTPLSALAASTELLLDQAPDLSQAELQELLTSLHLGIVGLQTLVDNLLESASLEAGRFRIHPRPSDLGQTIADATRLLQPLQDKYGQRLVVELPATIPVVRADPRRIVQVLVNLLSNAIKYSPDETEITIGATVSGEWVRVTVADRGPGVPPGYRPALFRRFVQPGTGVTKSQSGAGLGLSVVKAIVEAHGGQVGIEDRPGGGSIFWFTLPLVKVYESPGH